MTNDVLFEKLLESKDYLTDSDKAILESWGYRQYKDTYELGRGDLNNTFRFIGHVADSPIWVVLNMENHSLECRNEACLKPAGYECTLAPETLVLTRVNISDISFSRPVWTLEDMQSIGDWIESQDGKYEVVLRKKQRR